MVGVAGIGEVRRALGQVVREADDMLGHPEFGVDLGPGIAREGNPGLAVDGAAKVAAVAAAAAAHSIVLPKPWRNPSANVGRNRAIRQVEASANLREESKHSDVIDIGIRVGRNGSAHAEFQEAASASQPAVELQGNHGIE